MRMIYRVCEMVKAFVCESQSANIHKLAMYRNGGPAGTKVRWMPLIRLFLPQWSLSLEFNLIPVPRPRQTSACWKMDLNSMHKAEATALNAKYIYILDWNDYGIAKVKRCGIMMCTNSTNLHSTSKMSLLHGRNATKQGRAQQGRARPSNPEAQALLHKMLLSQENSLHQLQQETGEWAFNEHTKGYSCFTAAMSQPKRILFDLRYITESNAKLVEQIVELRHGGPVM